ncbi:MULTISPECIES: hypothetical protein [Planktothricoides]|uniref:Uncharacterized protein n=1 Tax=Planktothricoides raciborskii FACHB-1370 TaxID=2949576 RepID=A0ABR8ECK0_9CYAN|nr:MULTISPECIES: hypothetical protein [Planktothricoides]MBD2544488.1 hypothetical protein [Planktothricoides raciborskii FACHB-1370]MBD2585968.1 hypothetical protein [Planktothricoides raciborskii FACHB-1261]
MHFSFPTVNPWIPAFAGMTAFLLMGSVVHLFLPVNLLAKVVAKRLQLKPINNALVYGIALVISYI